MTDSVHSNGGAGRGADKRARLVAAARRVLHEQGVEATTIADIAAAAGVPLGNVYYYFKTKDALLTAVLADYDASYLVLRELIGRHRSPQARLKALVGVWASAKERVALYGCPLGSLCSELGKRPTSDVTDAAGDVMQTLVEIAEAEFRELGRKDARALALRLVGAYEGAALLSNSLRDPQILVKEARRLEAWIDEVAA